MIIDFHRHVWGVHERYPAVYTHGGAGASDPARFDRRLDVHAEAEVILQELDQSGVDRCVIFLADYGLRLGELREGVAQANRFHAAIAATNPSRIVSFAGIDPRRPDAPDLFRRSVLDWGMLGLKLHPGSDFFPDDPICYPLYQFASDSKLPIAIHTGPMGSPLLSKPCQPIHIDRAAADFPDVRFVMLHAGQASWTEALDVAFWKPNVFLEFAKWQWLFLRDPRNFVRTLVQIRETIGAARMLFGSDLPSLRRIMKLSAWVLAFKGLTDAAQLEGLGFSEEDVNLVLGGTAESILSPGAPAAH